jgi:DnaJ family protein B protein 4
MGKDYYSILGISKDADDDTIKKAYRKQGKVYLSLKKKKDTLETHRRNKNIKLSESL